MSVPASVASEADRAVPAASDQPFLRVDEIVKRFDTVEGTITAVDRVSFAVAPGEFLSVIGPSGCGKSTLFNIIGGLIGDFDGEVSVAGERDLRRQRQDEAVQQVGAQQRLDDRGDRDERQDADDRRHDARAPRVASVHGLRSCACSRCDSSSLMPRLASSRRSFQICAT